MKFSIHFFCFFSNPTDGTLCAIRWTRNGHVLVNVTTRSTIQPCETGPLVAKQRSPRRRPKTGAAGGHGGWTGLSTYYWLVVWNTKSMFHNIWYIYIWDVILPIDERHHFWRWLLHHQPVIFSIHLGISSAQVTKKHIFQRGFLVGEKI